MNALLKSDELSLLFAHDNLPRRSIVARVSNADQSEKPRCVHFHVVDDVVRQPQIDCSIRCSPLSVVLLPPEFVVGLIHEHAVLEEHDVEDPPEEEDQGEDEEELPVGEGENCDQARDHKQVKQGSL